MPGVNRTDRVYAVVEELRAAGPRGVAARRLAERFEVSVRTIERDLDALRQAGVPLRGIQGRRGGYVVDPAMSLPPLNFTPGEAAAVAVAPEPDPGVAREVWRAVREGARLRLDYTDRGGVPTRREVDPFHVVLGPDGHYLTAFCHLRGDERVFRMDRITAAERVPGRRVAVRPDHVSDLPERMVRPPAWE